MYEKIVQLKFEAADGKKYATDCAETSNLLRIIQSIPLPESGQVSILRVTDKQFGNMQNFIGQKKQKRKTDESKMPMQLTLF